MARKPKSNGQETNPKGPVVVEDVVEDAVEVAQNAEPDPESGAAAESTTDATVEASEPSPEADQADVQDDAPQDVIPDATPEPEPEPGPEPEAPQASPAPPPPQVTVQKVGFVPLVLGGALAAAFGFGVAWLFFAERGNDMTAQIDALQQQVAALPSQAPDLAPLSDRITASEDALTARMDDVAARLDQVAAEVTAQIAEYDTRLTSVERAPGVDGTLAETAIASWEAELDTLRAEIAAQQARMGDIATTAEADLEASRAAAAEVEERAAAAAQEAISRAALARIQVALDSGMPFDAALADLTQSGIEPPAVLADAAAEGVPSIGTLRETFPDAARAALAVARAEGLADVDTNPVTAFLRNQFDVRSVTPREGDDPDAILSRAGAALNDNRLTDALAEIEGLPEVARAAMTDWIGQADARAEVAAAIETLDSSSNN